MFRDLLTPFVCTRIGRIVGWPGLGAVFPEEKQHLIVGGSFQTASLCLRKSPDFQLRGSGI